MSDASLDDLLAELNGTDSDAPAETPEADETPMALSTPEPEAAADEKVEESAEATADPLEGLLVGEKEEPQPEPVKKPRGRPRGSTKAKTAAKKVEEEKPADVQDETPATPVVEAPSQPDNTASASDGTVNIESVSINAPVAVGALPTGSTSIGQSRDIYLVADSQIFNGHIYRRGQRITFTKGDKFYNSQTDRNGVNWLDHVDDLEWQYAHFGRILVKPDTWDETPIGSTEGIHHPGLALAIAQAAQLEIKRNGVPFN